MDGYLASGGLSEEDSAVVRQPSVSGASVDTSRQIWLVGKSGKSRRRPELWCAVLLTNAKMFGSCYTQLTNVYQE